MSYQRLACNSFVTTVGLCLPCDTAVPLIVTQVLFVCTANDVSQIARPLLDRMESIELSGYSIAEKVHIAKRFLLPKIKDKVGLQPDQVRRNSGRAALGT